MTHTSRLLTLTLVLLCTSAQAHTDAAMSFTANMHLPLFTPFAQAVLHPWTGLDHLLAMVLVGVWCALTTQQAWRLPLVFSLSLAVGFALGAPLAALPLLEPMVALSLLVLGLLTRRVAGLPGTSSLLLMALFGVLHGAPHGQELASGHTLATLAGMLLGSTTIQTMGYALGRLMRGKLALQNGLGLSTALVGAGLLTVMA